MINWLRTPTAPEVAKYVERYWFLEKQPGSHSYQYPKLNPDPTGHLIIAPPEQPYHYELDTTSAKGEGCHWIFPHTQTFRLDHSQPFFILGIKFRTGALYSLDVTPEQPMLDQVTAADVNHLLNSEAFNQTAILAIAKDQPDTCRDILDELLLPWLFNNREDQHSKLTRNTLPLLAETPVSQLGDRFHCSQRTLERSFRRVTGLTLKQCQSINRLEMMLEYLYQRDLQEIDWVELAYQFGFSDQPHLIRYLKSTIGATPNVYAKQRDLTIDIYGGVVSAIK
ncbi:helix-turn-helix domain-containing protein [Photobacterium chitinilyticum]|uniref:helix-turn-helix domain-containing protein n=1 Tax=Photobacterium chitinilyticum TaxID=2485123 RepID=UPI003D14E1E5